MLQPRLSFLSSACPRVSQLARSSLPRKPSSPCLPLPRTSARRCFGSLPSQPAVSKGGKAARNVAVLLGLGLGVYAYDRQFNAQAITRTMRTAYHAAIMAADFKLNFDADDAAKTEAIHERVAKRIHHLCVTNGGLYIKLGQALGLQAAVLPKPYQQAFANIFDAAPVVSWDEVVKVFTSEFGVHPDEAFDDFSREAVASASIAQVHKARLKRKPGEQPWKEGEGYVAIKIRKPSIPIQVEWDLFSYRALMLLQEKVFDLPVAFIAKYISDQMRKEVSLKTEAENATRAARDIASEPSLRDRVTVPNVFWEWTGESVMTADFVTACKLTDKAALDRDHLSYRAVMDAANAVVAAQTFVFGFCHCDPHPGNVLVRPHPQHPGKPQIVLIDHGLYIELPDEFRRQYCTLWRSLFVGDLAAIEDIIGKWGIAKENSDIFASMTLLRPHKIKKSKAQLEEQQKRKEMTPGQAQVGLKERLKSILESQELIPRELLLLGRSQRMMQSNNQVLGSPSNRINSMAHWAVEGLKVNMPITPQTIHELGLRPFLYSTAQNLLFRVVLFVVDIGFALTQARQWLFQVFGSKRKEDFESILQRQVTEMAKNEFGVDIDESAFTG